MKNYNEKEKFKAYCVFALIGLASFSFCYLVDHTGGRSILYGSVTIFISYYLWKVFYRSRSLRNWIWWCATCNKEVSYREVNEEEIHINCGREATYKLKK